MSVITEGDKRTIEQKLMPYFGVKKLTIKWSNSKKVFPDVWCYPSKSLIVITQEWARQKLPERLSRITHELAHIGWGLEHRRIGNLDFNTKPELDTYSKALYKQIIREMR